VSASASPTELPETDPVGISGFWARMRARGVVEPDAPRPTAEFFGDSVELADELLDLILHGPKRATAGAHDEYLREGAQIPYEGMHSIVLDGRGAPRALLRTTDVRIGPLSSVDDRFAWDEGEGDRTRDSWLRDHGAFFERYLPTVGLEFSPDMPTVFERFELVAAE
jgi:uncharacterized protein YhfF